MGVKVFGMKYIKSLMLSLVLVAVAATGFNGVASAAGVQPVSPSQIRVTVRSSCSSSATVSWWYPSVAKVSKFTVAVNGNREVETEAGIRSAGVNVSTNPTVANKITVRAWLHGESSQPATVVYNSDCAQPRR